MIPPRENIAHFYRSISLRTYALVSATHTSVYAVRLVATGTEGTAYKEENMNTYQNECAKELDNTQEFRQLSKPGGV